MNLSVSGIVPALMGLFLLAGCMSFDYVGQSFAPLNDSAPVNLYKERSQIPADQYRIIGRAVLSGPNTTDLYDREAKLRQEARAHGADAVCITGSRVIAAGLYPSSSGAFAPPLSASGNADNLDSAGRAWESDSFGKVQTLNSRKKVRYTFETKVIFLKKTGDFNREMKSRPSFP